MFIEGAIVGGQVQFKSWTIIGGMTGGHVCAFVGIFVGTFVG